MMNDVFEWCGVQTALPMSMVVHDSIATSAYFEHIHNSLQLYIIMDIRIIKIWRREKNIGKLSDDMCVLSIMSLPFVYVAMHMSCKFHKVGCSICQIFGNERQIDYNNQDPLITSSRTNASTAQNPNQSET